MYKSTSFFLAAMLSYSCGFAQSSETAEKKAPNNWHLLDKTESGFNGISLDKAYEYLISKKIKSKKVTVAVIDSGIDTLHEDLKPILWVNSKEIPGNGKDDDKNGYVDDVHGWNFLGGKDGRNVKVDSYEGARVYHKLKSVWGNGKTVSTDSLSAKDLKSYTTFKKAEEKVVGEVNEEETAFLKNLYPSLKEGDSILRLETGKEEYNGTDLQNNNTTNAKAKRTKGFILNICKANNSYDISNKQLLDEIEGQMRKADAASTPPPTYRKDIVQDDETNINDKFYGNNDIMASTPFHGTHCSGIIGAVRKNEKGMDGVADNVSIMTLRAVPDGDEHDKDIANAIIYAVNNGAKIVSMSFGKDFSPEKKWVDEAFKFAEKKGVLLIHAAGNDAKNIDTADNFPSPVFEYGKGRATNVITVGASGDQSNGGLTARFSNFGKYEVDVFAPGVNIYSTIPGGNTYGNASGTSMACPVVSGIAALIMEYFPKLNAVQVKSVIEKSVIISTDSVKIPGTDEKVMLSNLSKTGGFVNAFEAVKLADQMSSKMNIPAAKPKIIKPSANSIKKAAK
jgi:subtilisin family serine protease